MYETKIKTPSSRTAESVCLAIAEHENSAGLLGAAALWRGE